MSAAQLIELVIFAAVVFVIINKLLATLGSNSEHDGKKPSSFFGDKVLKDVTNSVEQKSDNILFKKYKTTSNIDEIIVLENKEEILEGLSELEGKLHVKNFSIEKFLTSAKIAIRMIIDYANEEKEELSELIDKRYLTSFKRIMNRYGSYIANNNELSAKISEVYVFGNNIFIKVLFSGSNVVSNINDFSEEWTFTKQSSSNSINWYLSNIE